MNRFVICAGLLFIVGCSSQGTIKDIIRDQQFSGYKVELEQLEKDYLQKKISYAEYLDKKKHVEEQYQRKIDTREQLLRNQNSEGTRSIEALP